MSISKEGLPVELQGLLQQAANGEKPPGCKVFHHNNVKSIIYHLVIIFGIIAYLAYKLSERHPSKGSILVFVVLGILNFVFLFLRGKRNKGRFLLITPDYLVNTNSRRSLCFRASSVQSIEIKFARGLPIRRRICLLKEDGETVSIEESSPLEGTRGLRLRTIGELWQVKIESAWPEVSSEEEEDSEIPDLSEDIQHPVGQERQQQPPAATNPETANRGSVGERLTTLKQLHDDDLINDQELEEKKKEILASL